VSTADQDDVIRFLESPATHAGAAVERVDTHASIVFLAGSRAWKLKRAVRYDYLDYLTVDRRRAMCERELAINRRTAPALYRRVLAITREPRGLALGGDGPAVDWVIEMERFESDALFDRLAARGALPLALMTPLADSIAALHTVAERRTDHGGRAGMAWVIDGNAAAFDQAGIFDRAAGDDLTRAAHQALERCAGILDARRDAGFVRQCHGDLHLRNIVLIDSRPTLFDAIEFNDEIACVDVMYDLAFLLMDVLRRTLPAHANAILNRYLRETGDIDALALLPLFLSCRAAIRAKTSAAAAALAADAGRQRALEGAARDYLQTATGYLQPAPPTLVAVGGFSGSGKSTLAQALAPMVGRQPGAVVIRSDEIRKRVCGVAPLTRLGAEGYAPAVSARVYEEACLQAGRVLRTGHSAVVDAVFARPADRAAIEQVGAGSGAPFLGLWLEAPQPVLTARVAARRDDVSDADAAVIGAQLAAGIGDVTWERFDTSRTLPAVVDAAQSSLRRRLGMTRDRCSHARSR
jgi:aminoglycoside phosphotransferase family enzyme/predicted kinase